jgi:hypothetical protein
MELTTSVRHAPVTDRLDNLPVGHRAPKLAPAKPAQSTKFAPRSLCIRLFEFRPQTRLRVMRSLTAVSISTPYARGMAEVEEIEIFGPYLVRYAITSNPAGPQVNPSRA